VFDTKAETPHDPGTLTSDDWTVTLIDTAPSRQARDRASDALTLPCPPCDYEHDARRGGPADAGAAPDRGRRRRAYAPIRASPAEPPPPLRTGRLTRSSSRSLTKRREAPHAHAGRRNTTSQPARRRDRSPVFEGIQTDEHGRAQTPSLEDGVGSLKPATTLRLKSVDLLQEECTGSRVAQRASTSPPSQPVDLAQRPASGRQLRTDQATASPQG